MVTMRRYTRTAVAALAFMAGASALAGSKEGVEAWDRGDYAAAVAQWRAEAGKGDADAAYNLAQAYRLGRGVAQDTAKAEELYARAAAAGHPLAADNYGLLLFQKGQRSEALPYLREAAGRGDPRAQYLLGISHFNGDLLEKDWPRAYALVTLANGQGLPQAAQAIGQMDQYIPLEERQKGAALATQLQAQAEATRAQQLASADLARGRAAASAATPLPSPVSVPVSAGASQDHLAAATRATGTESPASAGADYARPQGAVARPASAKPAQVAAAGPKPATAPVRKAAEPARAAPAAATGPWRVQLGAFSVAGNAEALWRKLGGRGPLAGKTKILVPAGKLTRLLAGGFASEAAAASACATLRQSGQSCLVTR